MNQAYCDEDSTLRTLGADMATSGGYVSRRTVLRIAIFVAILAVAPVAIADDVKVVPKPVFKKTESMVPMEDGTELATDVYLPSGSGPFPVLLMRTPYSKDSSNGAAREFCKHGYAVVVQDLRGRFKSKGHHAIIFHNDGWCKRHDGHDTINWIAKQPWCNGKVGSFGGSANGITQNMAAPGAPQQLKAQFVQVAYSDMYSQGAYQGGAWRGLVENWLKATNMVDVNLKTFVAHPKYDSF